MSAPRPHNLDARVDSVTAAIARLVREHGLPNTFYLADLAELGPGPLVAGNILREFMPSIEKALAPRGIAVRYVPPVPLSSQRARVEVSHVIDARSDR